MLLKNKILIILVSGICLFLVLVGCLPKMQIDFSNNNYKEVEYGWGNGIVKPSQAN